MIPSIALLALLTACTDNPLKLDLPLRLDGGRDIKLQLDKPPFFWPEAGDLLGADTTPAGSDRCLGASRITLASGFGSVSGNTAAAKNEFAGAIRCGRSVPFAGPQHYYKVDLTYGKYYRFTLTPQFNGVIYLFSECGTNIINADCSSGGASGDLAGPAAPGQTATLTFTPDETGTYFLGVDSASSADAGAFSLEVKELPTPKNSTCKTAEVLVFSGGAAQVTATTLGSSNEFANTLTCGLGVKFIGPQVYYSLSLNKGTWYRFSLSPKFAGALWLANTKAGCSYGNINVDCGGVGGTVLPLVAAGKTGQTAFSPLLSGSYLLAVGSPSARTAGDFSLTVESFTPAGNMVCSGAAKILLSGGKASIKASTAGAVNDSGASIACGPLPPMVGAQRYYQVDLLGKPYRLQLTSQFSAMLALGQSCATLPADCGTNGVAGGAVAVGPGSTGTITFTPPGAGTYWLTVDSAAVTGQGAFELLVQEEKPPSNGACATPGALTLAASPASELGDTSALKNDLKAVSCGHASGPFDGPAAYFKVNLLGGKTYSVTLTPEKTFDPALYAFAAATSCTAAAVDAACKGQASDKVGAGLAETLTLSPVVNTDMILAVDSWSASEVGRYTLSISWK